jgi:hypothetical protein
MSFTYPVLLLPLALLVGALYAGLLYAGGRAKGGVASGPWRRGLALLRFVVVSALAVLLLDPVLRYREVEAEKPLLLFALDNSASMALSPDSARNRETLKALSAMQQELERDFDTRLLCFSSSLEEVAGEGPLLDGSATDLSAALESLSERYANRNVGAVVLASDGIYNLGSNPAYGSLRLGAPIYAVGLGDTTRRRDLRIDRFYANRLVYLDDQVAVRLDLSAFHASGEMAQLSLERVGEQGVQRLESRSISLDAQPFNRSEEFIIRADRPGILHLRARFGPLDAESSLANNTADLYIEVLDARQRILLLGHAPHPDLGALRQVMASRGNYEVRVVMARDLEGSLEGVDLLVLHQLPSAAYPLSDLLSAARSSGVPVWFIMGERTDAVGLNRSQDLLRFRNRSGAANEVTAQVAGEFALFSLSDGLRGALPRFPPLTAPFGDYTTLPQGRVVLRQRIGSVESPYPLLVMGESGGVRSAVMTAEGLFQWRLFDFQETGEHARFEELMGKTLQYLAVKSDRRLFRTLLARNLYTEREPIVFQAELYNESYEPVNTPDVDLVATSSDGRNYEYRFNREGDHYTLNAGALPPGDYRYVARTRLDQKDLEAEGRFSVSPMQLEALELRANHGLLASLAESSGGAFLDVSGLGSLADSLRANQRIKPVLHESVRTRSVINFRTLFFVLLALLGLEWLLRRIQGGY